MITVGAHEARTHLAKLIRAVEHGEAVIITRRGKPVAKLGPVEDQRQQVQEAIASIKRLRRRLPKVPVDELIATIHEGHKY
jgi:prevent-host-death family protein